ncbi:MAG: N-acetylneuraminate synthase family protein [Acidobacteriota bacterium]|nr:N-acetylneuraminate synthase family protein [Acidobacteriota bacterium]
METLDLAGRLIGPGEPPYIIAEIGSNHNGDMELCQRLIDAAKNCGADAVKFQSWSNSTLISKAEYGRNTKYTDTKKHFGTLKEMVDRYQFTPEQHHEIAAYCNQHKITFLSSCFSIEEVDLLDSLDVLAFKVASMDVNHFPLLEYITSKKKPVILSTGMATLGEIERALSILRRDKSFPVALLHCISLYPPPQALRTVKNIMTLQHTFDVPVGFSDHTLGTTIALAAIASGACIIEKHFTLDKDMDGWDHSISANPDELEYIVREGRTVHTALGSTSRTVSKAEIEKRKKFRRRLVIRHSMKKGQTLHLEDLDFKRPGTGIHPDEWTDVINRSLARDVSPDDELEWSDLI